MKQMELDRNKTIRELEKLYYFILNSNLAERFSERDIMAIVNAASLLAKDEQENKRLIEENERLMRSIKEIK